MTTTAPAGWYHRDDDPEGLQRYWDGSQWTEHTHVAPAAPAAAPTGPPMAPPPGPPMAPPPGSYPAPMPTAPPPGSPSTGSNRSSTNGLIVVGVLALFAVLVIGAVAFTALRGRAPKLNADQAEAALPSERQIEDIFKLNLTQVKREAMTKAELLEGDGSATEELAGCTVPSTDVSRFGAGGAGFTGNDTSKKVGVVVIIVVAKEGTDLDPTVKTWRSDVDALVTCLKKNRDFTVERGATSAGNGEWASITGTQKDGSAGILLFSHGNTLAYALIYSESVPVRADHLNALSDLVATSTRNPDPNRA